MNDFSTIIVDNDEIDLIISQRILSINNLATNISLMRGGRELIQFLQQNTSTNYPDYVLLDYNMPGQSGLDVLDEIKQLVDAQKLSNLPYFIVSSCSVDFETLNNVKLHAMVDGVMFKPINPVRLTEILTELKKEIISPNLD